MKKLLVIFLCCTLAVTGIPSITIAALSPDENVLHPPDNAQGDTISVYFADTDTVEQMDFREYVTGVVAAEMPVEFHSEALSAGACAAATLARLRMKEGTGERTDGAVISTDPKTHQAYMTKEQMSEKWEGDFDSYYKKLCKAVDKAIDYSITYGGELIVPAYHAISPGRTEDASNVWGGSVPYLVSVESPGDSLCEKYLSCVTVSFDEFSSVLENEGAELSHDITLWLGDASYTPSGTLLEIEIGGKAFSGADLREMFSLRSNAVTLSATKDGVTMTVRGYGHGVGMSQYGADYLARQGYSWQEIIHHFYTDVDIEILNF